MAGSQRRDHEERRAPTTVFLVDDHELVRRGLRQLLEVEPDVEVVGEATTSAQALARIPAVQPDVVILDLRLPDGDGVSVCRTVRSATTPPPACLILTSFSEDEALFGAIMAGARGYLLKQSSGTDLLGAVRTLARGGSLIDDDTAANLLKRLDFGAVDPRYASLTQQERKILELIAKGRTNRQIAGALFLAERTVANYVSSLLRKLGFSRRTEAAVYAASVPAELGHASRVLELLRDNEMR
ncbi:response regulator [Actinokineospora globicatena]|uniref:response regulator n=1 Tax=Actinokineospora globicatena TaxID=103729 RepID=UPI002557C219|nr:response regulator transcription factor [Actinokineospora globicatena]